MTGIHWDYYGRDGAVRIKSYGAVTKGEKSTIRIELDVTDPDELSHILRQCKELADAAKAKPKKPLALTYQPGEPA